MRGIKFTKMVASGNDFVLIEGKPCASPSALARQLCDRKFGAGADGLLLVNKTGRAGLRMRIINADGSEAEMCGNGARCAALYSGKNKLTISTLAGEIDARVFGNRVKIRLTEPRNIMQDIPLVLCGRPVRANFIDTGVPHAVIFVQGLDKIDVDTIGRIIRKHPRFAPAGTNVDFVEVSGKGFIRVRTYERGVEGETLACGTGSTAAALIFAMKEGSEKLVRVRTQSKEVLKVYFKKNGRGFKEVWLEGRAQIVYKGVY
jgi:diaminopimelate epimerase